MKYILVFLVFLSALALLPVSGGEQPYTAYTMFKKPVIDGKLDEPAWKMMDEKRGFFVFRTKNYAAERETSFRIGRNGNNLYLGVFCGEPAPGKITAHDNHRDGLWNDDAVEFFFLPVSGDNYLQVVINAKGLLWTKYEKDSNTVDLTRQCRTAAFIGDNFWSVEAEIPLSVLDPSGKPGEQYKFLLARTLTTASSEERLTSYPAVVKFYGEKEKFAPLQFSAANGAASPDPRMNAEYDAYFFNLLRSAAGSAPSLAEEARYGHTEEFKKQEMLRKEIAGILPSIQNDREAQRTLYRRWIDQKNRTSVIGRSLEIDCSAKDASAVFKINGQPIRDGRGFIREGISILTVEAVRKGNSPGVRVNVKGAPEITSRWKVNTSENPLFYGMDFNDAAWPMASEKDGWFWSSNFSDAKVTFRQAIVWNETPFGPDSVLFPPVREWGFSQGILEAMQTYVYSPFKQTLKDYELNMEFPAGIEMLSPVGNPSWGNWSPKSWQKTPVVRDGKPYIRYTLGYSLEGIPPEVAYYNFIPVRNVSFGKPGDKFNVYLYRRAAGNFTELESVLPARVLPPPDGRILKKLKVQLYTSVPYLHGAGQARTDEEMEAIVESNLKAGINRFIMGVNQGARKGYLLKFARIVKKHGAQVILSPTGNHPIWGTVFDGAVSELLKQEGFRARGFNDAPWYMERVVKGQYKMFCPTKILLSGREAFAEAVRKDYAELIRDYPADGIFLNWEQFVWPAKGTRGVTSGNGDGAYCFCPLCKRKFGKYKNIPNAEKLSDQDIYDRYADEWEDFRHRQDAAVHGILRDVVKSMGLRYVFYCQTAHKTYWAHAKGTLDELFVGCPGNPQANANWQKFLDDSSRYFREVVGEKHFIGQRFAFFEAGYNVKQAWKKGMVLSDSGIFEPETWKTQIIRLFASNHGGIDLSQSYTSVAGMLYYVGEATRLAAEYEDFFYDGARADSLAVSKDIEYPNLLVLTLGDRRLVLLFNETNAPRKVSFRNLNLRKGQNAVIGGTGKTVPDPSQMTLEIPPHDVVAVNIQ